MSDRVRRVYQVQFMVELNCDASVKGDVGNARAEEESCIERRTATLLESFVVGGPSTRTQIDVCAAGDISVRFVEEKGGAL